MGTLRPEVERIAIVRESDGSHLKESPGTVQVKVTVSIGHGLSTLTEYCAEEIREQPQCDSLVSITIL